MDPRQRSADRRRFQKIGLAFGVGLVMVAISIGMLVWVPDGEQAHGRRSPVVGIPLGLILMGAAGFDLTKRFLSGPTKPGKRAKF